MNKIIVHIDPQEGYTCPDGKVLEYVQHIIDISRTQQTDFEVTIGSSLIYDAFRLSHVRKECVCVIMIDQGDVEINEYAVPTKFKEAQYDPFKETWDISCQYLKESVQLRQRNILEQKYKDINPK
jgi:hypothetical protein